MAKEEKEIPEETKAAPEEEKPEPVIEAPAISGIKLFGKYEFEDVSVSDAGMVRYIDLRPINVPHTGGKFAVRQFAKAKMNVVERLINNMMRTEKWTGKKLKAYDAVEESFDIIAKKTKTNPLQVFVDALVNASPREEVTRLQYGGISVPKAVDVAPSRRVDLALRHLCQGALASSHGNKRSIAESLSNEIIMAAKKDMNCFSITRKEEIERVAASAR